MPPLFRRTICGPDEAHLNSEAPIDTNHGTMPRQRDFGRSEGDDLSSRAVGAASISSFDVDEKLAICEAEQSSISLTSCAKSLVPAAPNSCTASVDEQTRAQQRGIGTSNTVAADITERKLLELQSRRLGKGEIGVDGCRSSQARGWRNFIGTRLGAIHGCTVLPS